MDLNSASIAAQREAEAAAVREQAKRIVDNSVTRLDPVIKDYTSGPIGQLKNEAKHNRD
jgi:hypothetical protein